MAVLTIARMGNRCLKEVAAPVADPTAPEIRRLAADMRETLEAIDANGIAAPQVGVSKRVVVYRISERIIPPGAAMRPIPWRVLVNPVVTPTTDAQAPIWEKCLSLPGLHGQVPRYTSIRLQAQDLDGGSLDIAATGFHAMILQHECDHLDGILYPMRMTDHSTLGFDSELGAEGFRALLNADDFRD